jgi:hypothetical protein
VSIDTEEWFSRIEDVRSIRIRPPRKASAELDESSMTFGKTTSEKVIDRLAGR